MANRPRHPVEGGNRDDVELVAGSVGHEPVECRPAGARARNTVVDVGLDDLPAAMNCQLLEVQQLAFGMLVDGADASVKSRPLHSSSSTPASRFSSSTSRRWRPSK